MKKIVLAVTVVLLHPIMEFFIVPQLHYLEVNGHKVKTNNMIQMQLTWIKSYTINSKMTTVQER
jgi:hypothetical protein